MRNHMTTNNFSPSTSQRWLEENIGKQTRHYGGTVGTNLRSESLGSRQAMIVPWYLLLNMKLTTLWRGTHHVITPGYPLLPRGAKMLAQYGKTPNGLTSY